MDAIMGSISDSGTGCAAPTKAWGRSILTALAFAAASLPYPAQAAELSVTLQGLRSERGQIRLCLTRDPRHFPNCAGDPHAVKRSLPSTRAARLSLDMPPGDYALSVIHDENGNGRLDTFLRVPREGFGFSRNPAIRMGPPRFEETRFRISEEAVAQSVRIRYIL